MNNLRKYIKNLVLESIDSRVINQIQNFRKLELKIDVSWTGTGEFEINIVDEGFHTGHGLLQARNPLETGHYLDDGQCNDAYIVQYAEAQPGLGPLLYDIAIEVASNDGSGLTCDRNSVSDDAYNVWQKYLLSRDDILYGQLDDLENPQTKDEFDDCGSYSSSMRVDREDGEEYLSDEEFAQQKTEWYFNKKNPISKFYYKKGMPVVKELIKLKLIQGDVIKDNGTIHSLKESVDRIEEIDISKYADDLEDLIFNFLFSKSNYDKLKDEVDEAQIVLRTPFFDNFENINEVHLGITMNDDGAAVLDAAYVCVPDNRTASNLFLNLDIPRTYPHMGTEFQDWLSAELADTLSHEIQHSCDPTEMLTRVCISGEEKWDSLENIGLYYGCEAEVRGHVAGILGRSRSTEQDPYDLLDYDMQTILSKAVDRGYQKDELIPVIQDIYNKWFKRLENKL